MTNPFLMQKSEQWVYAKPNSDTNTNKRWISGI